MAAPSVPEGTALASADRPWRLAIGLMLPIGVALAPRFLALGDIPLCAFKHLTGVPCPLCGGIRACAALAQGDVASALLINPGLLPVLALPTAPSSPAWWRCSPAAARPEPAVLPSCGCHPS